MNHEFEMNELPYLHMFIVTLNDDFVLQFMDHLMAGIEDIVGKTGSYNVRDKFKRFDTRFIRPLLIRDLKVGICSIM